MFVIVVVAVVVTVLSTLHSAAFPRILFVASEELLFFLNTGRRNTQYDSRCLGDTRTLTHTHTRARRQRTTFALKYLWLHQRQLQQATTLRKGNGGMNKKTDKDWQGTSLETWSTLSLLIAFGQILSAFLSLSLVALPHTHTHFLHKRECGDASYSSV